VARGKPDSEDGKTVHCWVNETGNGRILIKQIGDDLGKNLGDGKKRRAKGERTDYVGQKATTKSIKTGKKVIAGPLLNVKTKGKAPSTKQQKIRGRGIMGS